jgi:hypothetical protein
MAASDKLGLGLDDIIRSDRTINRRGRGGGNRGFRGRTGRGGGIGFRTRGGGGLVSFFKIFYFDFSNSFYLASNIKSTSSSRSLET